MSHLCSTGNFLTQGHTTFCGSPLFHRELVPWPRGTQLSVSYLCFTGNSLTREHTTCSVLSFFREFLNPGVHNLLCLVLIPQRVPCPRGAQPSECGLSYYGACTAKNGEQSHTILFWGGTGNVAYILNPLFQIKLSSNNKAERRKKVKFVFFWTRN